MAAAAARMSTPQVLYFFQVRRFGAAHLGLEHEHSLGLAQICIMVGPILYVYFPLC